MTSRDFCYFLQGFFEISSMQGEVKITDAQARIIQAHLNLVFKHEIDPENFKDKSEKEIKIYEEIHKGAKSSTAFPKPDKQESAAITRKEIQPQPFRVSDWPKSYFDKDDIKVSPSEIAFNC